MTQTEAFRRYISKYRTIRAELKKLHPEWTKNKIRYYARMKAHESHI